MGGAAKAVKKVGNVAKYVFPVGYVANVGAKLIAQGKNPVKGLMNDYRGGAVGGEGEGGSFSITPEEIAYDRQQIEGEGDRQYQQLIDQSKQFDATRATNRANLGNILTGIADKNFVREIPNLAEDANAGGVYTGTGFSEALAREKAKNIADIQDKVALKSIEDTDLGLGDQRTALGTKLGFQGDALSRGFSLEDFIRESNVAKAIGAQATPQVSGKSRMFGGAAQGAGAGASFGPWGAAIGGAAGALANAGGGKKGK